MKFLLRILLVGLVLMGSSFETFAQFTLSAQVKPRVEFRDGFRMPKSSSSDPAFFVSQRTRLNLSFENEKVKLFVSPQDVRTWGSEKQLGNDASFGLHEAWGQLKICDIFSVKAGRQEIIYDGHRLLGNVDWVQQGRSHDALMLKLNTNGYKLDFTGAFNQSTENVFTTIYRPDNYKVLLMTHAEKKYEHFSWAAIVVNDASEKNDSVYDLSWRSTTGALLGYNTGGLSLEGSFYYQSGMTQQDVDISAFLFNLKAMYKIKKHSIAAGLDYVSGDDLTNKEYQAFNTLFGTNHKFYGFMDYFLNIPVDAAGGGLQDYYLNANFSLCEKSTLKLFYHQFLLAADVPDAANPTEFLESNMGGEIDAVFVHKIAPYAIFNLGFSVYMPTATTEQIKGGSQDEINTWGWAMLVLKPQLFTTKPNN